MSQNIPNLRFENIKNQELKEYAEYIDDLGGGDGSSEIDTDFEKKSIFDKANELVKDNKLSKEDYKEIFGFEYGKKDETQEGPVDNEPDANGLTNDDKKALKKRGERKGADLYKYLNGGNGWSILNGFDAWGLFGDDGHEKANSLFSRFSENTDPLEIAYLVKGFNSSKKEKQEQICEFMMNESWDKEEECIQKIADKVIEMCERLEKDGYYKHNPAIDDAYTLIENISKDKDILETYDDDSATMQDIDEFVARISDLYIEKYGAKEAK